MKKIVYIIGVITTVFTFSCNDDEFLTREPTDVLTPDQVFSDPTAVLSVLANLYTRYIDFASVEDWPSMVRFNQAFISESGFNGQFQNNEWGYGDWGLWTTPDDRYLRDLNQFIKLADASDILDEETKNFYVSEARFLRASFYFEWVKRMGGVPLITEPTVYDFSGDVSGLQFPRATEAEIYDFIIQEADEIKDLLPNNEGRKSRATKGSVLAMKSRAALYAASIARYGQNTPTVSLPGGEVGIPASRAIEYYEKSLEASEEIINSGIYSLYNQKPNLSDNFAAVFYEKNGNTEAIFVEDYLLQSGKDHSFTVANQPTSSSEDVEGGRINPSVLLVQSFETLDGEYAPLANRDESGNFVYYDNVNDIFEGRDARLEGTIIVPGASFKGKEMDIWAGYLLENGDIVSATTRGGVGTLPGGSGEIQVVGFDGPINNENQLAQTGFYIRKYLDPKVGSGQRGLRSDVWFIRYRYAEILLNAAEALFELKREGAANYINQIRSRAGITAELTDTDINFDRIFHERYVEFAFEGLYFFDLKRWRLAHVIFDGQGISKEEVPQNIGSSTKRRTQVWGLWPYKYYEPGDPNNGKWVFELVQPSAITGADQFRLGNYYSEIGSDVINNNPKIIRNPFH